MTSHSEGCMGEPARMRGTQRGAQRWDEVGDVDGGVGGRGERDKKGSGAGIPAAWAVTFPGTCQTPITEAESSPNRSPRSNKDPVQ